MIIYPPYIDDTIPAFTPEQLVVPFTQNPGVSKTEYSKCQIKYWIYGATSANMEPKFLKSNKIEYDETTKTGKAYFNNPNTSPNQYYKIQLAYANNNSTTIEEQLSYSTVSVGRCILAPSMEITQFQSSNDLSTLHNHCSSYLLVYTANTITSEPIYSYSFLIRQKSNLSTIEKTGEILYNSDNDFINGEIRSSRIEFYPTTQLLNDVVYQLVVQITTINGYVLQKAYDIVEGGGLELIYDITIKATQDACAKDNGYVNIEITDNMQNQDICANFIIERSEDNGSTWKKITEFTLPFKQANEVTHSWKDQSCESGASYIYSVRQYATENNITYYSTRKTSNPILVNFEHLFLIDKDKQLKIAFNPNISSIKNTILESKTDSIGSKYPFFFRNGNVKYKEFPISGLISYLMDEQHLFMKHWEIGLPDENYSSTNLSEDNIIWERRFKLAVLDWLTNGQPKLLKSATEGNYAVRLMNVSLSPQASLGRMLHNFSATGYECADISFESLQKNKLISFSSYLNKDKYDKNKDIFVHNIQTSYENVLQFKKGEPIQFPDGEKPTKIYWVEAKNETSSSPYLQVQTPGEEVKEYLCEKGKTIIISNLPLGAEIKKSHDDLIVTVGFRIDYEAATNQLGNFVLDVSRFDDDNDI